MSSFKEAVRSKIYSVVVNTKIFERKNQKL